MPFSKMWEGGIWMLLRFLESVIPNRMCIYQHWMPFCIRLCKDVTSVRIELSINIVWYAFWQNRNIFFLMEQIPKDIVLQDGKK